MHSQNFRAFERAKVNLRKAEAVVHFDASRVTPANLTEAITAVGFKVFE